MPSGVHSIGSVRLGDRDDSDYLTVAAAMDRRLDAATHFVEPVREVRKRHNAASVPVWPLIRDPANSLRSGYVAPPAVSMTPRLAGRAAARVPRSPSPRPNRRLLAAHRAGRSGGAAPHRTTMRRAAASSP